MKEETSTKLDKMKDTKWEYGYAIRCAILICVMTPFIIPSGTATEALEGHFSYYLLLICYSLIVITYLLMLTWFHIDMPNSDCYVPDFM